MRPWWPLVFAALAIFAILTIAGTPVLAILSYVGYAVLAVVLPGTLVFRALRRTPFALVEDLAMGAAVGLALELGAWAVFSALDLRPLLMAWPLLVVVPFIVVPRLRRHWVVRGYTPAPIGLSWTVATVAILFVAYLFFVFLDRNPILPTSEDTRQYLDLAYQLSLAGEAQHRFPPGVPQVAGEPLYYHWFGHAHMAATAMIGHIDLPVVSLRLAVPALSVLAVVLTATVGWRVSGRPAVGAVAAVLFWVVGEVNFTSPITMPFGTQATFVIWHGMSMIYSWVLLLAAIAAIGSAIGGRTGGGGPPMGRGAYVIAALLLLASSGAKASSLPVVLVALAVAGLAVLAGTRRLPWAIIAMGAVTAAVQVVATVLLFRFQTYGVGVDFFATVAGYWQRVPGRSDLKQLLVVAAVLAAFVINMQLRVAGVTPLVLLKRGRLEPVQWFLLGGAFAGPALYLTFTTVASQYFTRAGFAFGVLASAWGYMMVVDRARLGTAGRLALGAGAAGLAVALSTVQILFAGPAPTGRPYSSLVRILEWSAVLLAIGAFASVVWWLAARRWRVLRGRWSVAALTAVLVAGSPGLVMDAYQSLQHPNGGAYFNVALPRSRVEAARWIRDHSRPTDVVATNVHCIAGSGEACDPRSFWLSAYTERSVLVEGWSFAPRMVISPTPTFWDPALLRLNDAAFTDPTGAVLDELRQRHGVRWLVVDRQVGAESPQLAALATLRFDNGRLAVYEL